MITRLYRLVCYSSDCAGNSFFFGSESLDGLLRKQLQFQFKRILSGKCRKSQRIELKGWGLTSIKEALWLVSSVWMMKEVKNKNHFRHLHSKLYPWDIHEVEKGIKPLKSSGDCIHIKLCTDILSYPQQFWVDLLHEFFMWCFNFLVQATFSKYKNVCIHFKNGLLTKHRKIPLRYPFRGKNDFIQETQLCSDTVIVTP